jgi:hypothetical protein
MRRQWQMLACSMLLGVAVARADITLLTEEPYGKFGGMTPTGHAAVYLSRVCAETPVVLRRCRAGETGVVISRYHRVGNYDWLAIPLIPYLYAVDRIEEVPEQIDADQADRLRDQYRRAHLEAIAPDGPDGQMPAGDWTQLVGESYLRTMFAFGMTTTEAQDDRLIAFLNGRPNENHFGLLSHNCADFARQIIDFYYPHVVHRDVAGDLGIMTPKQAAQCVVRYDKKHPGIEISTFVIPQVHGSVPRSSQVRGVLDSFVHTKKYAIPLAPLAFVHPLVGGGMAYAWVEGMRFKPHGVALTPDEIVSELAGGE